MTIGKFPTRMVPKKGGIISDTLKLQQLERLQERNRKGSGFYPDTNTQVANTLNLSPEAQEKTEALQIWIGNNSGYSGIEKIRKNVSIHNDGLHIETSLGMKTLAWKEHTFGGVDTLGENLGKQKYTIEEMGAIIEALGGKKPNNPLKVGEQTGGPEISSFLSEIAGVELGRFYWSSSEHAYSVAHAWGLYVFSDAVFVGCYRRNDGSSSLASQN